MSDAPKKERSLTIPPEAMRRMGWVWCPRCAEWFPNRHEHETKKKEVTP